jgi:hypothetical protein
MRRAWAGLALLSASWLFGLRYYHAGSWPVWAALVVMGTGLFTGIRRHTPGKAESILVMVLLLPVIAVAPWPYRVAPLLIVAGLALCLAPIPRRWPKAIGSAALLAGIILTAQALAVVVYESITARSHELPRLLSLPLMGLARLLGLDAALDGSELALYSVRTVHRLGATWELLLDPPTLCFLVGGLVMLWIVRGSRSGKRGGWWGQPTPLTVLVALWLPVRAVLLMSILVHRALRTEYETPLSLMNQFWNPWILLVLLLVPVLLAIRFVRVNLNESVDLTKPKGEMVSTAQGSQTQNTALGVPHPTRRRRGLVLVFTGVFLFALGVVEPAGQRRGPDSRGRVHTPGSQATLRCGMVREESDTATACMITARVLSNGRLTTELKRRLQNYDVLVVGPVAGRTPSNASSRAAVCC